ncbi:MAG TPA: helix-turn-helix domain-containing protein [Solirubrobacterales bacterium]|nr:helix-turn-helix domain-containing protein [Solirubrobacterales bacterium]
MSTKATAKAGRKSKTNSQIDDPLFDMAEAAEYLGMTERWMKDQLQYGTIPRTKLGRLNRFRKSHLDKWIEENTTMPEGGS